MDIAPQVRLRESLPVPHARSGGSSGVPPGRLTGLAMAVCSGALFLMVPADASGPEDAPGTVDQSVAAPAAPPPQMAVDGMSQSAAMEVFLDRLMLAESGGRLDAKNPRSTALGPFQFIESTFLSVAKAHFAAEVAALTEQQILALRTNMDFARRAARAYVNHMIAVLAEQGLPPTMVNLRLAFLVGPAAGVRLLKAEPDRPLKDILSADAIAANPFMAAATAASLIRKAAMDISGAGDANRLLASKGKSATATAPATSKPPFEIKCAVTLAPCRKWIAMQERKLQSRTRSAQR